MDTATVVDTRSWVSSQNLTGRPAPDSAPFTSSQHEHLFQSRADENAASRIWAGIHFRTATDAGLLLGREVGDAVIAWAEADGSA